MKRRETWYLRRRVPIKFAHVEPRIEVWLSLHTDSETLANQKAVNVWQEQLESWEARLLGEMDLSRFCSGQVLMLGGLAFEGHGAFPTQG